MLVSSGTELDELLLELEELDELEFGLVELEELDELDDELMGIVEYRVKDCAGMPPTPRVRGMCY